MEWEVFINIQKGKLQAATLNCTLYSKTYQEHLESCDKNKPLPREVEFYKEEYDKACAEIGVLVGVIQEAEKFGSY